MKNMKKCIRKIFALDDRAVSPIIAVILMVAITVVLAGAIYAWVTAFGGTDGGTNVILSLKQNSYGGNGTIGWVCYRVNSVGGNPGYEDMEAQIDGKPVSIMESLPANPDDITDCSGAVHTGDDIYIVSIHYTTASTLPGRMLNIEHKDSDTIIFSTEISYAN